MPRAGARALDRLARALVDSSEFTRIALDADAWPYSRPSALLFASLLHLSGRMEGAQFWFQYAAGAGSATAARALYLLHLSRSEVTIAHHWQKQTTSTTNDDEAGLPALPTVPEDLESSLGASVIWASPPSPPPTWPPPAHRPQSPAPVPLPLHRAMTALVPREDLAHGEVYRTTSQLASALARCAGLAPAGLTADAKQGARVARRAHRRPTCSSLAAAHRALRVLEVVHRHTGGVRLTQIARETGLGQLHLNQALQQLVRAHLATPITPDVYTAGSALQLAAADRDRMGELRDTLGYLRDAVGAAVYVASYTEGDVSITQYADGPRTPVVHEWVDAAKPPMPPPSARPSWPSSDRTNAATTSPGTAWNRSPPTPSQAPRSSSTDSTTAAPASPCSTCRSTPSAPSAPPSPSAPAPTPSAWPCPYLPPTPTDSGKQHTSCATKPSGPQYVRGQVLVCRCSWRARTRARHPVRACSSPSIHRAVEASVSVRSAM